MIVLESQMLYVKEIYEQPKEFLFRKLRVGDQIYIRHKVGDDYYAVDNAITSAHERFSEDVLYKCLDCFRFGVCK